jgi:hypothetical protein
MLTRVLAEFYAYAPKNRKFSHCVAAKLTSCDDYGHNPDNIVLWDQGLSAGSLDIS